MPLTSTRWVRSTISFFWKKIGYVETRTWGSWVRSKNAIHCAMRPPIYYYNLSVQSIEILVYTLYGTDEAVTMLASKPQFFSGRLRRQLRDSSEHEGDLLQVRRHPQRNGLQGQRVSVLRRHRNRNSQGELFLRENSSMCFSSSMIDWKWHRDIFLMDTF